MVASKDQELARLDQTLQLAELEKESVIQGLNMTGQNISSSKSKIEQLLQEKESLERQLNLRENENLVFKKLTSISEALMKEISTEPEMLEKVKLIITKDKEISSLKRQLQAVRIKLEEAKTELSDYREKLLNKLVAELKEKSKEAEYLKEVNAMTKLELDLERAKLDKLRIQQTMAAEDEKNYMYELQVRNYTLYIDTCMHF